MAELRRAGYPSRTVMTADNALPHDAPRGSRDPSDDTADATRFLRFLADHLRGEASDLDSWCTQRGFSPEPLRHLEHQWRPLLSAIAPAQSLSETAIARIAGESREEHATTDPTFSTPYGRYEVREEIARGGMGRILAVWDRDLGRELAMKVVIDEGRHSKADLLERFLREARITSRLEHPGVVPVHEVGVDDEGRVFFTMRRIRGRELGEVFASSRGHDSDWSVHRALEGLLKVCDTIAFAHSHGVVHRDLKPENIMVGDFGEVYVMDWGLAKDLHEACRDELDRVAASTRSGSIVGTPYYMAPEQATGVEVGPAADIYALGALLYTLLAGEPPYAEHESTDRVLDAMRAGPPRELDALPDTESTMGPLRRICLRAMARAPADRFGHAGEMAHALRVYLADRERAEQEAARARAEAERSRRVADFVVALFEPVDPYPSPGARRVGAPSALEILNRGTERLDRELIDEPAIRARLSITLGDLHRKLGSLAEARRLLESGLALLEAEGRPSQLAEAEARCALGLLESAEGRYSSAETQLERARTGFEHELGPAHVKCIRTAGLLAEVATSRGRYGDAEARFREVIEQLRHRLGDEDVGVARLRDQRGWALQCLGRYEEAKREHHDALAVQRARYGPTHPVLGRTLSNLAAATQATGELGAASELYHEAIEIHERTLGRDHPETAIDLNNLAVVEFERGEILDSIALYDSALRIYRLHYGETHPEVAIALNNVAMAHATRGDFATAEPLFDSALEQCRSLLGENHLLYPTLLTNRSAVARAGGDLGRARRDARDALARFEREVLGPHPLVARAWYELARIELQDRELDEARRCAERALAIRRALLQRAHPDRAATSVVLARIELASGEAERAEQLAREALADLEAADLTEHLERGHALEVLGETLRARGDIESARSALREAATIFRTRLVATDPRCAVAGTLPGNPPI
ncbi:MAG: tetratricopeptide repeat protein [Planctomycetes bacterium]|nr:tetratricopeptide repeat protein [Planctomycetota bacterium]